VSPTVPGFGGCRFLLQLCLALAGGAGPALHADAYSSTKAAPDSSACVKTAGVSPSPEETNDFSFVSSPPPIKGGGKDRLASSSPPPLAGRGKPVAPARMAWGRGDRNSRKFPPPLTYDDLRSKRLVHGQRHPQTHRRRTADSPYSVGFRA